MKIINCIVLFCLLILNCFRLNAQVNWKDSIIAKNKPVDAYVLDDLVYFKTKKGWGVYYPAQKSVVLPPKFDFILATKELPLTNFYVVKKNKISLVDNTGKSLNNKFYFQLGEGYTGNENYILDNGYCKYYDGDSLIKTLPYKQFAASSEYSLTLKNNLIFVNIFEKASDPYIIFVERNGEFYDSVDVNGYAVLRYNLPKAKSGVYNLLTGKWIIELGVSKVGNCKNNLLATEHFLDGSSTSQKVSVYDKSFQKTSTFSLEDAVSNPESIKSILSDYNPLKVEKCFNSTGENFLFKFTTDTYQGLLDPFDFSILIEPNKYEFIFCPNSFEQTIFTVANGKVGSFNRFEKNKEYSNLYNKLEKTNYFIGLTETWHELVTCNNEASEPVSQIDTGQINPIIVANMIGFKRNASVEIVGQNIIVQDFIPKVKHYNEPIRVIDAYGEIHDSIIPGLDGEFRYVYMEDEPSQSFSGVYNIATKSWLIPRKYSKILKTESGFSCILDERSTVLLTLYNNEGKVIFNEITVDSLLKKNELVNKFCGFKFGSNLKYKKVSPLEYFYEGCPVILNEAKNSGVFDFYNLKWLIKPENDFIDFNSLMLTYNVVKDNKLGLNNFYGIKIVAPLFNKIEYKYQYTGYIVDDSLFYEYVYPHNFFKLDTAKSFLTAHVRDKDPSAPIQVAKLIDKKLYVEESTIKLEYNYSMYDESYLTKNISYTRMIDLKSYAQTNFFNALKIDPWKTGHIIKDTLLKSYFVNSKGESTLLSEYFSIFNNDNYIHSFSSVPGFVIDPEGKITNSTSYYDETYDGYTSLTCTKFFDGESIIETPQNFYLLALNKSKLGLGYTLQLSADELSYIRQYSYYDFNTRQMQDCNFDFSQFGELEVFDVKGYFVFADRNREKSFTNVWLMEEDLKTIKSTFKELFDFSYQMNFEFINKEILFHLKGKDGKEMYFDKDFHFILEAEAGEFEIDFPFWDRLVLKSTKKTVQMNLKGQILNK